MNPFKVVLNDNRLSDRGVAAIVDGLRGGNQLDELDLSANVVSGRATQAFVPARETRRSNVASFSKQFPKGRASTP